MCQNTIKNPLSRVLFHTLFWIISVVLNAFVFKYSSQISSLDFYYALLSHLSILLGTYFNYAILIPLFFKEKRYIKYSISVVFLSLTLTLFYGFTFNTLSDIILPDFYFVSQFNTAEAFIYVSVYLSFTTLLTLSESWFELQDKNKQLLLIEKENIDSQLKALKSQINPHFLFNSLNLIYAEALKKTELVPDFIIRLSENLRYVIYKSNHDTIKLSEEIDLIENYLTLLKQRSERNSKINFEYQFDVDHNIAPMLFLPLIENSFKHGIKGNTNNTFLQINLKSNIKETQFYIANNQVSNNKNHQKDSGVGIANIKKRLLLLYPNRHKIEINDLEDTFEVSITIQH